LVASLLSLLLAAMALPERFHATLPAKVDRGIEVVKVFVGATGHEFSIYKNPLYASTKFFERAIEGPFKEGVAREITLPDDEPEVFAFFCDWLYLNGRYWSTRSYKIAQHKWHIDFFWFKVYCMSDRLMIS